MESYKMWKMFENDRQESVDVLFSMARREAVERYNEEVSRASTVYLHMAVMIGGGNLTKEVTKKF